jgi:transposase InsO family protein
LFSIKANLILPTVPGKVGSLDGYSESSVYRILLCIRRPEGLPKKAVLDHVRGKPHHPQTQGKIEQYHRTMKNIIRLEHYYSPDELETQISSFVDHYNNHRCHESLVNVTPADV